MKPKLLSISIATVLLSLSDFSQNFIIEKKEPEAFPIVTSSQTASIFMRKIFLTHWKDAVGPKNQRRPIENVSCSIFGCGVRA